MSFAVTCEGCGTRLTVSDEAAGRCIHRDEATGAGVVSWTGPKDTADRWAALFVPRFVRGLPPDTLLVVVDHHM